MEVHDKPQFMTAAFFISHVRIESAGNTKLAADWQDDRFLLWI
jgi:hypothetical protein